MRRVIVLAHLVACSLTIGSCKSRSSAELSAASFINTRIHDERVSESTFFQYLKTQPNQKVPFPFNKFRESLSTYMGSPGEVEEGTIATHMLSSLSPEAKGVTPTTPRAVGGSGNIFKTRDPLGLDAVMAHILFGYVEHKDFPDMQIISWNLRTLQNDFIVVKNYTEDGERKPEVVDVASCNTCHQSESGLFPSSPWVQATTGDSATFGEPLGSIFKKFNPSKKSVNGILVPSKHTGIELEALVGASTVLSTRGQICKSICDVKDVKCKTDYTRCFLAPNRNSCLGSTWVRDLSQGLNIKIFGAPSSIFIGPDFPDDFDEQFRLTPAAAERLNPRVEREKIFFGDMGDILNRNNISCLGLTGKETAYLTSFENSQIEVVLDSAEFKTLASQEAWPMDQSALLAVFKRHEKSIPTAKSLELLNKHCGECHSNGSTIAAELPLQDLEKLKKFVSSNSTPIANYIKDRSMPPRDRPALSESDRNTLLEMLKP